MTKIAYVLQPTAEQTRAGITAEQLGVRALPADATPAMRAHAEAVWHPAAPTAQCPCSGTGCPHGQTDDGCGGLLIHIDRYPGSMFDVHVWADTFVCSSCEESVSDSSVTLPELPWGEVTEDDNGRHTVIYEGIRHPNFGNDGGTLR